MIISVLLLIVIIAVIVAVLKVLPGGKEDYPYEKQNALFSEAERSFLGVLEQVVGNRLRIMGKVRLADVVKVKPVKDKSTWQKAFNRIQSKHLDFVVCDADSLRIKFVIELDDKSHSQFTRQQRDEVIDNVLRAAGIPVFHFVAKRAYSIQELRNTLFGKAADISEENV